MPRPWGSGAATTRRAGGATSTTSWPEPSKVRTSKHHAALDWREAPAFMAELAQREGTAAKALAFAILTAARSGEVRGA